MKKDKTITLYYFASLFDGLWFITPIWLLWFTKFIDVSTVGILEAFGFLMSILLEVPTGALADIIGRKKSVIMGKVGMAIGAVFVTFASSSFSLIIGIMLFGVFSAFISGAGNALIYDHLVEKKKEKSYSTVLSRATMLGRVTTIIASFTGGFLFDIWEPLPYFIFIVTNIMQAFVWAFIQEPALDTEKYSFKSYKKMIREGWNEVTRTNYVKIVFLICLVIFSSSFLFREYFNYPYALDLDLDAREQSILFGISGILKLLSVALIGYLLNKFAKDKILKLFFFLFVLFLLPANFVGTIGGVTIILLLEIITAAGPIISDSYINKEFSSKHRATANSFMNMFASIIHALGLLIGLRLISDFGSPIVYTVCGGILLLLSVILLLFYVRVKRNVSA